MAVILAAQGVSAGIILGGQLYRGRLHSGASEIGHVRVMEDGDPCVCGHDGCLQTIVGEQAVLRGARTIYARRPDSALGRLVRNADEITMATVATAYQQGDPPVLALGAEMSHYLGIAAASLHSVLNVPRIVLAGDVAAFGAPFAAAVEAEIRERTLPWLADRVSVRVSTLEDDAVELGAAAVLLANELGVDLDHEFPVSSRGATDVSASRRHLPAGCAGQPRLSPGGCRVWLRRAAGAGGGAQRWRCLAI